MSNPTPQEFLASALPEYGFLLHEKALCEARGLRMPPQSAKGLQELEGWIYNNVPPQVAQTAYDKAMSHAERFRRQYNDMAEEKAHTGLVTEAEQSAAKMTEEFSTGPLSAEGRKAVSRGEKVSLKTDKTHFDKALWNDIASKSGFKDYQQLFKEQDHLEDLRMADPVRFKERLGTLNKEGKQLSESDIEIWGRKGAGFAVGMMERNEERDKDMPDYEEVEPDEQDIRRANLQDAFMDATETPPTDMSVPIDQTYLDDQHMTGDIARAWQQVEAAQSGENHG